MQKSAFRKWSARIAVPASGAQAGTPHQFRICDKGRGYDVVVEFPNQGGYAFRVLAGKCQTVSKIVETHNEAVRLYAVRGSWKGYDDRRGIDITTAGTYGAVNWSWQ